MVTGGEAAELPTTRCMASTTHNYPKYHQATAETANTKMTNMDVFCWYHSELIDWNTFYMFHFAYSPYWCSNCPSLLSEWERERLFTLVQKTQPQPSSVAFLLSVWQGVPGSSIFLVPDLESIFLQGTLVLLCRKRYVETSARGQTGIVILIVQVRKQSDKNLKPDI